MFTALGIYFSVYKYGNFKERANSRGGLGSRKQVFSGTNGVGHRSHSPNEEMRRERKIPRMRGKGGKGSMGRNYTEEEVNANTN